MTRYSLAILAALVVAASPPPLPTKLPAAQPAAKAVSPKVAAQTASLAVVKAVPATVVVPIIPTVMGSTVLQWSVSYPPNPPPPYTRLDASFDLTNWFFVASNPAIVGNYNYTDAVQVSGGTLFKKFYRVQTVNSCNVVTNLIVVTNTLNTNN